MKQQRLILRNCGHINPEKIDDYITADGYKALGKSPEDDDSKTGHRRSKEIRVKGKRRRRLLTGKNGTLSQYSNRARRNI